MKNRVIVYVMVAMLLLTLVLSGCGARESGTSGTVGGDVASSVGDAHGVGDGNSNGDRNADNSGSGAARTFDIVCTIFPQYDWTRQILGDNADHMRLSLLLDSRIDMHNYQPSVDDIVRISTCDLFIYVGGSSDAWVEGVLKDAMNQDMLVLNLLDVLGDAVKYEEIIEGMEHDDHDHDDDDHDHDQDHDHDEDEHDEDEHEADYDEHVWLSLHNAKLFSAVIADALAALDVEHAQAYRANLAAYVAQLDALDATYQRAVSAASVRTLLFGDRFPFRYLVDDYGIAYYAAFPGCSAETEASFETIVFLVRKMDELRLQNILVTESGDKRIAETIARESAIAEPQILVLDAMQSVSTRDVADGISYLAIMERNLDVLKEALGS